MQSLRDHIAEGCRQVEGVQTKGCEVMRQRTPETGAGIVRFRKPGFETRIWFTVCARQAFRRFHAWAGLRTSPHFYIRPDDIDQMLEVLP